jgi:peptidoglycan/LPS O-acetylase OafA/YrhL
MATTSPGLPAASPSASPLTAAAPRFAFLDGLRGLAALGVCCYHIERYAPYREEVANVTPEVLTEVVRHAWCGVQVFFVISGFVIAYCLRQGAITPHVLGEFLWRRAVRLTPPYFAIVLAGLALGFAPYWLGIPSSSDDPITWGQAVTHFFYLQNIFGYENLSAGFWTLCIEMQFYALCALLVGLAQAIDRRRGAPGNPYSWSLAAVAVPLGLLSLFWWNLDRALDDYVIQFWCLFLAGSLAWWVHDKKLPAWLLWMYLGAMAVRLGLAWTNELFAATVAGAAVFAASHFGGLGVWLNVPWLQYLGRISYSLYLVHFPLSHVVLNFGHEWTGQSIAGGLCWMGLSVALSVLGADVFYRCVEAPCIAWAARYKRTQPRTAQAPSLVAGPVPT